MKDILKDNIREDDKQKENSPKDNYYKENESSTDKVPIKQTVLVKAKIKKKTLDDLGEIEEAKKHRSANRPLHKIGEFNKSMNFCRCCNLPCKEKGIIEPFHFCDKIDKFSECGLGISFYFHFFRFLIFIFFVSICVIIISMMIFNKHYTKGINRVCNNSYKKFGYNNLTLCEGFVTEAEEDLNMYSRFMKDWVLTFSSDNIRIYYLLYNSLTNESDNSEDVIINYSLLNFFLLITIFIINICYIILINARTKKTKFRNLTIRDYTILVSNAKNILFDYFKEMRRQNPEYVYKSQQAVENTEDFIIHVKKYILEDKGLNELRINNINMCYDLGDYMDLRDKLEKCKYKIFKIKHNEHIINVNSKKGNLIKDRYYYYMPLSAFWIYFIRWKGDKLSTLEENKKKFEKEIEKEINKIEVISEKNFTGYMFVSFEFIRDKETILKEYPNDFFEIMVDFFKNIKYYICCCCISKGENIKFKKSKGIDVSDPPEPEDLYWENFKYSGKKRFFKILLFFFICILIIGVSFSIVLGFTYWQNKITANERNINLFVKYLLSLLITIIIAGLNALLEYLLEKFTYFERHLSRTNYYLSLSIKIAVFTFLNSAIVPLIAKELAVKKRIKEINYNIDRNNLIVDDMFVMFLTNAFVTPIFWTLRIPYWFKRLKIYLLTKKENPDKKHYKTQRQLNEYYEYMDMHISYKYAYLAKTTAMTFFYLPIFPMGFIISFLGFILGYLLELFNFTHLYKRPEMLDESISKAYADNFIVILFIGGIGDLFFFYEIFPSKAMSLVNFIVFLVLVFIPYTKFLTCNFIGEKNKSEYYPKSLTEEYLEFYNDYERQNPFTKRLGIKRYLNELNKVGNLSDNAYQIAIENIDKINLMEIYYDISRNKMPIYHQTAMANMNNYSISNKNVLLRKSSINNNIRESTIDQKEKRKYFDSQLNYIFQPRQSSLEIIDEETGKYPLDTVDEEEEYKERIVNAYNNPITINMCLGPLPMDYNIYESMPLSLSKLPSKNENEKVNNSIKDYNESNSKDIREKIKKDINNYRNKKYNNEKKEEMKSKSFHSITESSPIIDKNNQNLLFPKNDYDSESKKINGNIPFKASIHQSQNTNTNGRSSLNSLNNKNKYQNQMMQDINKIPMDTVEDNNNEKEKNENSNNVSNNFEKIFDMDSSSNKIIDNTNNNYLINNNTNNSDSKLFPQDTLSNSNKENKDNVIISENNIGKLDNINNISDIKHSKSSVNDKINSNNNELENVPNFDGEKINMNLSQSFNKEIINEDNNNEFNNEDQSEDS